jgi:tRNA pseudouridine32 synthase/23S rRNA pseudouridine746 synthase
LKIQYTVVLKKKYPNASGPLVVHRLDMSTSGILLIAKNLEIYKILQTQFINKTIKKRYVALLDGILHKKEGEINLPLRVDLNDRPKQLICNIHGKPARTKWKVIEVKNNKTKVYFYPITGRTHQLRIHAAHNLGLNIAIVGDDLYGTASSRLHLHAEKIGFNHPISKKWIEFIAPINF